jgi:hypothetical protein
MQHASTLHIPPLKYPREQPIDPDHPPHDPPLVDGEPEALERLRVGAGIESTSLLGDGGHARRHVQNQGVRLEAGVYQVQRETGGFGAGETAVCSTAAGWGASRWGRWVV